MGKNFIRAPKFQRMPHSHVRIARCLMLCQNFGAICSFTLDMLMVFGNVGFSSLALWKEKVHFVTSYHLNKMEIDPTLFDEYL